MKHQQTSNSQPSKNFYAIVIDSLLLSFLCLCIFSYNNTAPYATRLLLLLLTFSLFKLYAHLQRTRHATVETEAANNNSAVRNKQATKSLITTPTKMVFCIPSELQMGKGKIGAQCAHAAIAGYEAALEKENPYLQQWTWSGQTKICLKVQSSEEFAALRSKARDAGLTSCVISDAGRTQVKSGTQTVLCIGPGPCDAIDEICGHLKLL